MGKLLNIKLVGRPSGSNVANEKPYMFLPANSDSNGVATEASVDVTMTTPDTTAPPTPAATLVVADAVAPPDARQITPHRSQESQTIVEEARTEATRQKVMEVIDQQFDLEILLRHAESTTITQELAKAERMLEDLRHAILSGNTTTLDIFTPHSAAFIFCR